MKNLVKNPNAETLEDLLGIDMDRRQQLCLDVSLAVNEVLVNEEASPRAIWNKIVESDVAQTTQEAVLVAYLIGHLIGDTKSKEPEPPDNGLATLG